MITIINGAEQHGRGLGQWACVIATVSGQRMPADTIAESRKIGAATDGGRVCIIASGDWNITAQDLHRSGILDGLGLSIIWPESSPISCIAGKGSLIDYSVIATAFLPIVQSCRIVPCLPCGADRGVRTTFYDAPLVSGYASFPGPSPFSRAVGFFEKTREIVQGIAVPTWEYAVQRLKRQAKKDVDDNRNSTIDSYVESIGIAESSLQAAYDFSLWSSCAEFLHLARLGVDVVDAPLKRLGPFLGRGKLPKVVRDKKEEKLLHIGMQRDRAEAVAWPYRDGGAFGADLSNHNVSVLRQLLRRSTEGHKANRIERDFIQNISCDDASAVCCIATILVAGWPTFEEDVASGDALKLKVREFKDALMRLANGSVCGAHALEYAGARQRLHRALMVKRRKESNEYFAEWICKDLANHSSKLHSYIKHNRAPPPPSMYGKDVWGEEALPQARPTFSLPFSRDGRPYGNVMTLTKSAELRRR